VLKRRLPQRPQSDSAATVRVREIGFQPFRRGGNLLLRLHASYAGLQPHVSFNPPSTAILQLVPAPFKIFLHRRWNPELHRPAHEGPMKALWRDAHNGVHNIIQPLRFPDNLRIALEASFPQLVT